ncbi:MAG: hypothetical protein KBS60_03865 [Phascolarctobacterium sp.]|nr:hypothetical protein [Candidatus Phascolarctobacterium caballi]
MTDVLGEVAGNKMLQLKHELVELRQRLLECDDEDIKKKIRSEIIEKETYYNILADRNRMMQ